MGPAGPALPGQPAVLLATWGAAWLRADVSDRELLRGVGDGDVGGAHLHSVRGLAPEPAEEWGLVKALHGLRAAGVRALRVALPVAGDPRGLPGPGAVTTAALRAGSAVLCLGAGARALVPTLTRHGTDLDGYVTTVDWQVVTDPPAVGGELRLAAGPPAGAPAAAPGGDPLTVAAWASPSLAEAEELLAEALATTTRELAALDVARWRPDVADALLGLRAAARRGRPLTDLPPDTPPRATRLLATADRLAFVLALADTDPAGSAPDARAAVLRGSALRTVAGAVRQARVIAANAACGGPAGGQGWPAPQADAVVDLRDR